MPAQFVHEHTVLGFVATRVAGADRPLGAVAAIYEQAVERVRRHAYADCHTLTFQLGGRPLGRLDGRDRLAEAMQPGTVSIQPAPVETLWQSAGCTRWMQFYLPIDLLHAALVHENVPLARAEDLERRIGCADPTLIGALYRCAREVWRETADVERIDDFALELARALARRLGHLQEGERTVMDRERLSPRQLGRAQAFIDAHLHEGVTAADVARALGLSRYHFTRAFAGATGVSPYRYVQRARPPASAPAINPCSTSHWASATRRRRT